MFNPSVAEPEDDFETFLKKLNSKRNMDFSEHFSDLDQSNKKESQTKSINESFLSESETSAIRDRLDREFQIKLPDNLSAKKEI